LNSDEIDARRTGVVAVYRSSDPGSPTIYRRNQVAEAEPAVPGLANAGQ